MPSCSYLEANKPLRCISQIATTFNDQGLMLNARVMYGKTENYLHMRLEVIASGQPDRTALQDTVGAVHTLTACSWLNCLETNGTKWMRHTHALLKILEVDGWESLNPSTNRSFYYGWKHRAFFESLIGKKALPLREPKSAKITSLPRALVMEHALEVPGIFWRSEKIHQQAHTKTIPRRIVTAVLTELEKSISKLKQWHLQWTKSFGPKPHYRTISVKAFRHFSALSGDQLAVFPMAYDFSHPQHEGDFRMLCICLLHLDLAIMNIDHAFPEFCIGNEFQLQLRSADYDAETCTADLCMLISWTTQPENMAFASIHAQRPLFYALKYYQSQGKEPQLTWSQTVLQSLKEKYGIEIKFPD